MDVQSLYNKKLSTYLQLAKTVELEKVDSSSTHYIHSSFPQVFKDKLGGPRSIPSLVTFF